MIIAYICRYKSSKKLQEYIFNKYETAFWGRGKDYLDFNYYRNNNNIKENDKIIISLYNYDNNSYRLRFATDTLVDELLNNDDYIINNFEQIIRKEKILKLIKDE